MGKELRKVAEPASRRPGRRGKSSIASKSLKMMANASESGAGGSHALLRSGFLIHDVSRLRKTAYDQRFKPFNITRAQWWVLANLSRRNCDGISQIELSRLLDVGKVTLGGLIDRLEESGFVVRVPDKQDRRTKRIMRSAAGRALCERMEIFARAVSLQIMRGVSDDEQRLFIDILTRMKKNLIDMDAVPRSTPKPRANVAAPEQARHA